MITIDTLFDESERRVASARVSAAESVSGQHRGGTSRSPLWRYWRVVITLTTMILLTDCMAILLREINQAATRTPRSGATAAAIIVI